MKTMLPLPVVVLLSGGVDSSALVDFYLRESRDVRAIHFQYGHMTAEREQKAAKAVAEYFGIDLHVVNLGFPITLVKGEYSFRNAAFIMAACAYLPQESRAVAIGIHSGTPFYDCTPAFVNHVQALMDGYTGGCVSLNAPFLRWRKEDIYEYCRTNAVPLHLTYSCERNGETPCGDCPSCLDRRHLYGD